MDLPGLHIPPDIRGKTAYDLLSSAALTTLIRQHVHKLELDSELNDHELHLAFEACFDSQNVLVRNMAETIGHLLGRNLGYILLTLHRGDAVNREAHTEWDPSYWDHWSQIHKVFLGGGLVSGRLGLRIQRHALKVLHRAGVKQYRIHISPYASSLALVGAARYASQHDVPALVLDFGSTMIKRGCAIYENGKLVKLQRLESRQVGWMLTDTTCQEQLSRLFANVVSVIASTWLEASQQHPNLSDSICISMAAYIEDGHPMPGQGGMYAQMGHVTRNLENDLSRHLTFRLGRPVDVVLVHDGTAAATTYAGETHAAVITIGTALGIGFPPKSPDVCPIASHVSLLPPPNSLR